MHADLTAIAVFACAAYIVKAFVDAWSRRRVLRAAVSEELLRTFMLGESRQRQLSSLFWGILAIALALAFVAIGAMDTDQIDPATVATVLAAVGLGNLVFFAVARRIP